MEQYNVTGMSCAACQARVEKAVSAVDGVTSCAVNLLTNSMGVEGSASPEAIIRAVEAAGYGASQKNTAATPKAKADQEDALADRETPKMLRRLIASLIFLLPLMYVSMGHMMWNWPLPEAFASNHLAMGIYEMLLAGIVMVINQKFFINGFRGVLHRSPNMDTLVALGSMASFGYSVYALFAMSGAVHSGNHEAVMGYMEEFYFESAAMILTLITVGKMLEAYSKGKTTNALKALMKLAPKTATLKRDGKEITVPVEEVRVGDLFLVKPGDQIPVDGIVIEGFSAVNESTFTGESVPVEKKVGDNVSTATINTSGYLVCEATRIGEDTALSQVIHMVSDAAATKAPIAKIADRVSGVFVPIVIGIALITFIVWLIAGQTVGYALARAISVLVISCPCALGLATPVAIMVGNGVGARTGILFKNAVTLEQAGGVKIVALDKTGTITTGQMSVKDCIPANDVTPEDLLRTTAALEAKSEHPISKAIIAYAEARGIKALEVSDFHSVAGNGLYGDIEGHRVYAGNASYISEAAECDLSAYQTQMELLASQGKTLVYVAARGRLMGMFAVADTIKEDSTEAIAALKALGLRVVMITGDHEITAAAIAKEVGVEEFKAGVKPDGKEQIIASLMEQGKVAMVGDGINDAPALTRADVGIAIGAGTDVAIDAADIVLTKSSLMDVAAAIRISRKTILNIKENLFWAFIYNIIGIPLAAGCYVAAFGWSLNPMFGAAAMSLSSFCVVMNALRLNLLQPYGKKAVAINQNETMKPKEDTSMKITVKGMMCHHCEAHVKEALEKLDGVVEAVANHSEDLVTITTSAEVSEADIKAAVEAAGYEFGGIQ